MDVDDLQARGTSNSLDAERGIDDGPAPWNVGCTRGVQPVGRSCGGSSSDTGDEGRNRIDPSSARPRE
jgi:hypothetical protein